MEKTKEALKQIDKLYTLLETIEEDYKDLIAREESGVNLNIRQKAQLDYIKHLKRLY